jgi:hypothetical protein
MAVIYANVYRPKPPRMQEHLAQAAEAIKLIEGVGARARFVQTIAGARPGTTAFVTEYDDLAQFADVSAKLQADSKWLAFVAKLTSDPTAELIESNLITDVPLP